MRARLMLVAAGGLLIAGLAAAPPAEAAHGWSFGAGFHVGGAHFRVGFGPPGFGHYPGPFLLTTHRLGYPGQRCHGACFRRGGGFYHHPACSVVGFHFGRGGYSLGHYLDRYSPYRGHRSYGRGYRGPYRSYGHYGYRDHHGYRDDHRLWYGRYSPRGRGYPYWDAPRYRQHDYWRRYRDWDDDSDSDSDRRHRRRGG